MPIFGCFKGEIRALNLVSLVAVISFVQERSVNKVEPPPAQKRYSSEYKFHTCYVKLLCSHFPLNGELILRVFSGTETYHFPNP